jgi:hypothetical protein
MDKAALVEDLFTTTLDGQGLKRFLTRAFGRVVADQVNWNGSDQAVRFDVAQLLDRDGFIDDALFVALWREHVIEWPAAREHAARCGFELPVPPPPGGRAPTPASVPPVAVHIDIDSIDPAKLPEMLRMLRVFTNEPRVTLEEVRPGSVILVLHGPQAALQHLVDAGPATLSHVLGVPVTSVGWDRPPPPVPKPEPPPNNGGGSATGLIRVGVLVAVVAGAGAIGWAVLAPSPDPGPHDTDTDVHTHDTDTDLHPHDTDTDVHPHDTDTDVHPPHDTDPHDPPPPNQAPTAVIGAPSTALQVGFPAGFDGTGSHDADGAIVSWSWDFGDGSDRVDGASVEHTYTAARPYPVTLTVTDDGGATGTATAPVTVDPPTPETDRNHAPTASIDVTYPSDGKFNVRLDGQGSADTDGDPLTYLWDLGDGQTSAAAVVQHDYPAGKAVRVSLTVTDSHQKAATARHTVRVPAAEVRLVVSLISRTTPCVVIEGSSGGFSASAEGGQTYRWNFGDGTPTETGTAHVVSHRFQTAGTFDVKVAVKDGAGKTGAATLRCSVRPKLE